MGDIFLEKLSLNVVFVLGIAGNVEDATDPEACGAGALRPTLSPAALEAGVTGAECAHPRPAC
jgi:hypothetical protein